VNNITVFLSVYAIFIKHTRITYKAEAAEKSKFREKMYVFCPFCHNFHLCETIWTKITFLSNYKGLPSQMLSWCWELFDRIDS